MNHSSDFLELKNTLSRKELPRVFDVEEDGVDQCAYVFCIDNKIPIERLDIDVFETLVGLRTVRDFAKSTLFQKSAKESLYKTLQRAFATNSVCAYHTQGILRPLVRPSAEELASSYARFDVGAFSPPFKTMGAHPFFSECVANKFLQFWVSPGGDLRFLCNLSKPLFTGVDHEVSQIRTRLGDIVTSKENAVRDRLQRKLESKAKKQAQREAPLCFNRDAPLSEDAPPAFEVADEPTSEEKERLRIRKERALAERARRNSMEKADAAVAAVPAPQKKGKKKPTARTTSLSAVAAGKKAESIELAAQHAESLAEREKQRIAAEEALLNMRKIGEAIQRGD